MLVWLALKLSTLYVLARFLFQQHITINEERTAFNGSETEIRIS